MRKLLTLSFVFMLICNISRADSCAQKSICSYIIKSKQSGELLKKSGAKSCKITVQICKRYVEKKVFQFCEEKKKNIIVQSLTKIGKKKKFDQFEYDCLANMFVIYEKKFKQRPSAAVESALAKEYQELQDAQKRIPASFEAKEKTQSILEEDNLCVSKPWLCQDKCGPNQEIVAGECKCILGYKLKGGVCSPITP